jgi:hypothetical protein
MAPDAEKTAFLMDVLKFSRQTRSPFARQGDREDVFTDSPYQSQATSA